MCGISYSLCYAAPEVVAALEAGKKQLEVDAAVDVWALGVIACAPDTLFALLTARLLSRSYLWTPLQIVQARAVV